MRAPSVLVSSWEILVTCINRIPITDYSFSGDVFKKSYLMLDAVQGGEKGKVAEQRSDTECNVRISRTLDGIDEKRGVGNINAFVAASAENLRAEVAHLQTLRHEVEAAAKSRIPAQVALKRFLFPSEFLKV